jgi:ABC-2 type transport system ATP-binding protein
MPADSAIETHGLTKIFRSRWRGREVRAVDCVSLAVPQGAIFGLLGPNGAGKTTFVKMLLSAVRPTSGRAAIYGRPAHLPESRRPVGYLPENHRFPTYYTGAAMLDCYAALSGMSAAERRRRIPELLALTGLEGAGGTALGKYSKGMLQRIGLAQALIHSPRLLILDEPTDGVDPIGRRQIHAILQQLRRDGVTVFVNSHLLGEVEWLCSGVAIINRGKLVLQGEVKALTRGKGYRLTAQNVSAALRDDLARRFPQTATPREGTVEIQLPACEDVNAAIDLLRARRAEIESIVPTRSTLEQVFIDAVEGDRA